MQMTEEIRPKSSERTCVGCGKKAAPDALVRLVLNEADSSVVADAKGGSFGRGAHVHNSRACLEAAAKKGLPRAFKREMKVNVDALSAQIAGAYNRRIDGLLSGGVRGGHVVYGTDKVVDAIRNGTAKLVLLAADARTAADRNEVRAMTGEGRALVLAGDRMRLASALGRHGDQAREGVAICAVTSDPLAAEVRRAWLLAGSSPVENAE
jgi:predicted RNA-binding protein YlxR (DUF448 family)